jgi:uncharacterized membrane protein YfcA
MSQGAIQTLIATIAGVSLAMSVYVLARRRRLSFRYTVGWLVLCLVGITAGASVPIVQPLADKLKVTPAALLSLGAVVLLLAICLQLSISISGMQEQIRRLTESAAETKLRLEEYIQKNSSGVEKK